MSDDRSTEPMAPESIGLCPKCRRAEMYGPTYEYVGGDRLRYACRRCGWSKAVHCADHPKALQEFSQEKPAPTRVPSFPR